MRFLVDESVDRLRREGHEIRFVAEMDPGIADEVVLSLSNDEASILLTADKDFGELVFRRVLVHSGVVLIRLAGMSPDEKADLVSTAVSTHGADLTDNFSVLTQGAFRIRRK